MPVVDEIAKDYAGEVTFLAVAGKSSFDRSLPAAEALFTDRISWGYDDSVWELYGNPYQPYTVLITADDKIVTEYYGTPGGEEGIRAQLDALLALHG